MSEYRGVSGVARKVSKVYRGISGVARKVKKQYRGVNGVARKFFGGEPWEEALDLVGYNASSLDAMLKNSSACAAMAANSSAVSIMKTNYRSQLISYIDSNWNEGLNLLNYKCGLKCYLFRAGNECSNITGGWAHQEFNAGDGYAQNTGSAIKVKRECASVTKNKLPLHNFKTITFDAYYDYEYMSSGVEWFRLFSDVNGTDYHWGYHDTDTPTQLYKYVGAEYDIARTTYSATITTTTNVAVIVQADTDAGLYVYNIWLN